MISTTEPDGRARKEIGDVRYLFEQAGGALIQLRRKLGQGDPAERQLQVALQHALAVLGAIHRITAPTAAAPSKQPMEHLVAVTRRRGRKKGSRNKPKEAASQPTTYAQWLAKP